MTSQEAFEIIKSVFSDMNGHVEMMLDRESLDESHVLHGKLSDNLGSDFHVHFLGTTTVEQEGKFAQHLVFHIDALEDHLDLAVAYWFSSYDGATFSEVYELEEVEVTHTIWQRKQ